MFKDLLSGPGRRSGGHRAPVCTETRRAQYRPAGGLSHSEAALAGDDRVSDPFLPIIGALNSYLHAYHMYRAEALRVTEIGPRPAGGSQ